MLAADKQVLDACLRNELQELRRMELENIITRFDSALTPSTLIAGFSFTAIVDLDVLNPDSSDTSINEDQRIAERVFYIAASLALALSLQVTAVASAGIIFGQRLAVQATAEQGYQHDKLIAELNAKFLQCTVCVAGAMLSVVIASVSVDWMKQSASDGQGHIASWTSSVLSLVIFCTTCITVVQMFLRLHTWAPASSKLSLSASQRAAGSKQLGITADEFYVEEHVRTEYLKQRQAQAQAYLAAKSESSPLVPCVGR
jgi:hypothetical protein